MKRGISTWREIKRAAVNAAAVATFADRSLPPATRADARRALIDEGAKLPALDMDRLSLDEVQTMRAILQRLLLKAYTDVELRVVGVHRSACLECMRREARHYIDVSDLDAATRLAVAEAIAGAPEELRIHEPEDEAEHNEAEGAHGAREGGAGDDRALAGAGAGDRGGVDAGEEDPGSVDHVVVGDLAPVGGGPGDGSAT